MVRSSQEGVFAESSSVCYPEQTDALLGQPLMQVLPQPGLAGPVQPLPSTAYMQQQYHHLHTGPSTARETVSQAIFFLFCFWHFARVKGKPSDSFFFFFNWETRFQSMHFPKHAELSFTHFYLCICNKCICPSAWDHPTAEQNLGGQGTVMAGAVKWVHLS